MITLLTPSLCKRLSHRMTLNHALLLVPCGFTETVKFLSVALYDLKQAASLFSVGGDVGREVTHEFDSSLSHIIRHFY